ncbi:hypothetical protein ACFYYY_24145 [Streptomyces sp. NPDC001834]|uniref:hypothetical protein n=1 Tax=Streptomyces sp. NPDC001834 TaxID=3364616 RepID=UPI00369CB1A0
MQAPELAARAVRVLSGDAPLPDRQRAAVRELVWGRLGQDSLGASALARFQERPDEGTASIVGSVLADELRTDPDFAALLRRALNPPAPVPPPPAPPKPPAAPPRDTVGSPGATARRSRAGAVSPPQFPPSPPAAASPRPAAAPFPAVPDAADVRKVWLLGFPQLLLAYVVMVLFTRLNGPELLTALLLLASTSLAAYGAWFGIRLLLRRTSSVPLIAGTVVDVLVLIRLVIWLTSWAAAL